MNIKQIDDTDNITAPIPTKPPIADPAIRNYVCALERKITTLQQQLNGLKHYVDIVNKCEQHLRQDT